MAVVRDFRALLSGGSWSGTNLTNKPVFVTFSFETRPQDYLSDYGYSQAYERSFRAFNAKEQAATLKALSAWGATSGIHFLQVAPGKGDMRFASYDLALSGDSDSAGYAYYPQVSIDQYSASDSELGGDVFMDLGTRAYSAESYMHVILHEIGHAIGLKHPHDGNPTLAADLDHGGNTVMTYNDYEGHLGSLDGIAARHLYGSVGSDGGHLANWSWNAASDTLTQVSKSTGDTIKGVSTSDVMSGLGGKDILFGAEGDDRLDGGAGDDSLHGGQGSDVLVGGSGNDRLSGGDGDDRGTDTADYSAAVNAITVNLTGDYVYKDGQYIYFHARGAGIGTDALYEIETVLGGRGGDSLTGDGGKNGLEGRGGNDALHGGIGKDRLDGGDGGDTLAGGGGRDTFAFSTQLKNGNIDTITDFLAGSETIEIARGVFTALSAGTLGGAAFRVGPEARDATDRIVYDDANGKLFYDLDGAGGRAKILFAELDAGLDLRAGDFTIV